MAAFQQINTTYIMLFELDAATATTTAWVLNLAQLTSFYESRRGDAE